MDTDLRILYLRGHETSRHTPEPGKASAPGGSPVEGGQAVSRRRHDPWCITKLGCTVAAGISKSGQTRTACEAIARPNTAIEPATEGALGPTASSRPAGGRTYDQPVDIAPHPGAHPSGVWRQVYHTECLETDAGHGLELPKAQQTRSGAKRKSHSVLEASRLASHKKKPQNLEPTWASLTRAGSCSSRLFLARGPRREKPRSFLQRAIGQRSRPSPFSLSHPNTGGWECIVDFTRTRIFAPSRLYNSSPLSSATCEVRLFFSGTGVYLIEPNVSAAS